MGFTGKIKEEPLGKPEPWGLSFGHFPFRSWPKPKICFNVCFRSRISKKNSEEARKITKSLCNYLTTICSELPAKEEVHEVDLEENVCEVEELAGKEAEGIEVVIMPRTSCQTSCCF